MNVKLLIILLAFLLFMIFFFLFDFIALNGKIKPNNEHGSARWATKKEIKKQFQKEKISKIKDVGFPICFNNFLSKMWIDKESPHWLLLGSTGSGKTATVLVPICSFVSFALNGKSVCITDPKGEVYHLTSQMFKNRGYKVLTLDFRNPEYSNKNNPLLSIINEYEKHIKNEELFMTCVDSIQKEYYNNLSISALAESNKLIMTVAESIFSDNTTSDPFWINMAKKTLEGLIAFYLEEYKIKKIRKEQITLPSIKKFQNSLMIESNLLRFKQYINLKPYGSKSKDDLLPIINTSDNTYKSIMAVFDDKMAIFDDINVGNIISESDFNLEDLGKEKVALYFIVPDESQIYYSLITLIVSILYQNLVTLSLQQVNKRLPIDVLFLLDEFANCSPFPNISSMVSVSRSRGMSFYFFIQSFAQLEFKYRKEVAEIITDNCCLAYLKTNSMETAQKISKMLDKKTIKSRSISESFNSSYKSLNHSTNLISRDLLTADEVKQLYHKIIIFPLVGHPFLRKTIVYNKFSCYMPGEYIRTKRNLNNLDSTFYNIEDIFKNDRDLNKNFTFIKEKIQNIFKTSYNTFIEKKGNECVLVIKFNFPYTKIELLKLRTLLNKEKLKANIVNDLYIEISANQ